MFKKGKPTTPTVAAAIRRRDRDSEEAGATTPQEQQKMVSQPLHKRGVREGRWYSG